jgi:hypothetical protein|tara:strand:+ start:550 stop:1011 length:462 start_codon:yes stop_codon:yes gene_type:complete
MSSPDPDTSAFNEFAFQTILDQYQEEEIWKMYKDQQKLDEQLKEDEKKIEYLEDARGKDEEFSLMNYSEEFDIRPVADNPGLFKDMETGAVLNMDNTAYKIYQQNKKRSEAIQRKQEEQNAKVEKMDLEVEEIKGDLKELKGLIRDLIKGLNN